MARQTLAFVPFALTNNPTCQAHPRCLCLDKSHCPECSTLSFPKQPIVSTLCSVPPVQVGKRSSYRHLSLKALPESVQEPPLSLPPPNPRPCPEEVDHTLLSYLRPRQSGRKLSPKSLTELNGLEPTQNRRLTEILAL